MLFTNDPHWDEAHLAYNSFTKAQHRNPVGHSTLDRKKVGWAVRVTLMHICITTSHAG